MITLFSSIFEFKAPFGTTAPHFWTRAPASFHPMAMVLPRVRIAVVGDVHGDWDFVKDGRALEELRPDLVLFVGDFGNENLEVVDSVSKLDLPKAVILGNHDAWYTPSLSARGCDKDLPESELNAVELQLRSLGDCHVGYRRLDFSELKLSIVGSRPFSWGGDSFHQARGLVSERFQVLEMEDSAEKIAGLALAAPTEHVLVFLGHNGPTGLGSKYSDICGKDWGRKSGGDHGDPDLEAALKAVKEQGSHNLQLVVFGHMHKELAYQRGNRTMLVVGEDKIIYVNAAVVPRVVSVHPHQCTLRNFTVIELAYGQVQKVAEMWVRVGEHTSIEHETVLYESQLQNV